MTPGFCRALAAGVAVLLCAGCAAFGNAGGPPPAQPFDILGRVLASRDGRAFAANFRWRRVAAESEIWLMSPAGTTVAHITAGADGATLTAADQQEYRAMSAESLTRQALGWPLPLDQLQYWVRGESVPGSAVATVSRDPGGRLSLLEQHGWRIQYAYAAAGGDTQAPWRLDLTQGGQRIRMVIDDWRSLDAR